jgi:DNA-binding protein HU-beta
MIPRMTTQSQLADNVWHRNGGTSGRVDSRSVHVLLELLLAEITDTLVRGEEVQLIGFGTFGVKDRKARAGFNPQTREPMHVPARRVPVFRAGAKLRAAVGHTSTP